MSFSDIQGKYMNSIKNVLPKTLPKNSVNNVSNETTSPNLKYVSFSSYNTNSILEPFSYNTQLKNLNSSTTQTNMSDLENSFNTTLTLYKTTYKSYLESLQKENELVKQYGGQNIQTSDGSKYYINRFGYARQYSNEAWSNKHPSCPPNIQTPPNVDSIIANMYIGEPMIPNMPCNLEGKVIDNGNASNKQYAYIDGSGKKHIFSNSETYQKLISSGTCPKGSSYSNNSIFNQIISGLQITNTTETCSKFDSNKSNTLYTQLVHLNDTLMNIANKIYNEVETMENEDVKVKQSLSNEKKNLLNTIYNLQIERKNMNTHTGNYESLNGSFQTLSLLNTSLHYQFVMYCIISVSLGYLIYRNMR